VTYADAITLLLAFFVMLFSFAKIDQEQFSTIKAAIEVDFGATKAPEPEPAPPIPAIIPRPVLDGAARDLEKFAKEGLTDGGVEIQRVEDGIEIELAGRLMFGSGSAALKSESKEILNQVYEAMLPALDDGATIEIEGHTDDTPLSGGRHGSNWGLSASRAVEVLEHLVAQGADPKKIRATGLAETVPKVPNRTSDGVAIPENQALNRRVVIRVYKPLF
jgi:chemotaxis protein MotB